MRRLDEVQSLNLDSVRGVPGGVVSLGPDLKIPLVEMPILTSSMTSSEFLAADGTYRVITIPSHTYSTLFANSSLVSGNLEVNHNLSSFVCAVSVVDENDSLVIPDSVEFVSENTLNINLSSFQPLVGTWSTAVMGTETVQETPPVMPDTIADGPALSGIISYVYVAPEKMTVVGGKVQSITDKAGNYTYVPVYGGVNAPSLVDGQIKFERIPGYFLRSNSDAPSYNEVTLVAIGKYYGPVPTGGDEDGEIMGMGSGDSPYGNTRTMGAVGLSHNLGNPQPGFFSHNVGANPVPLLATNSCFNETVNSFYMGIFKQTGNSTVYYNQQTAQANLGTVWYPTSVRPLYLGGYARDVIFSHGYMMVGDFLMSAAIFIDHALSAEEIEVLKNWVRNNWPEIPI